MMRSARIKPADWQQWLTTDSATNLLRYESVWIDDWLSQLRGQYLLYAGADNRPGFLQTSMMDHAFQLEMPWQRHKTFSDVVVSDFRWPLADCSVDMVVLQHALDLSAHPKQLLREAGRVLMSSGYIVLLGFNSRSLWGGVRWLCGSSSSLPWSTRPIRSGRLEDWLGLLDFRIEYVGNAAHLWPFISIEQGMAGNLERLLSATRVFPGAVYMIVARKTVAGMTNIKAKEREMVIDFSGAIPVTRLPENGFQTFKNTKSF